MRLSDLQTGFRTRALYSTPLIIRGTVLAVLQFVNKEEGEEGEEEGGEKIFSQEDGDLVDLFAAYIGLALHHAKLYDKIRKNQAKSCVSLPSQIARVSRHFHHPAHPYTCVACQRGVDVPQPTGNSPEGPAHR